MSGYVDTSFLVSLYSPDRNSAKAARRMSDARLPLMLTPLGELELINALQLRVFRKEVARAEARAAYAAFHADVRGGILAMKPWPATVYAHALRLAQSWSAKLGTRTLDILHVASALALKADTFNTFDDRQKSIAQAAGLATPEH